MIDDLFLDPGTDGGFLDVEVKETIVKDVSQLSERGRIDLQTRRELCYLYKTKRE